MKLYSVRPWPAIEETRSQYEEVFAEGIKAGRWHDDTLNTIRLLKSHSDKLRTLARSEIGGNVRMIEQVKKDLSAFVPQPIIGYAYLDLLEARSSDYPSSDLPTIMTQRLSSLILSLNVNAVEYAVQVIDTSVAESLDDNTSDINLLKTRHLDYVFLHFIEEYDLFDRERSNPTEGQFVLNDPPEALPAFFRVPWRPYAPLLATAEGKGAVERAGMLGVRFDELNVATNS